MTEGEGSLLNDARSTTNQVRQGGRHWRDARVLLVSLAAVVVGLSIVFAVMPSS